MNRIIGGGPQTKTVIADVLKFLNVSSNTGAVIRPSLTTYKNITIGGKWHIPAVTSSMRYRL